MEFPWIENADTLIVTTASRRYKLHSNVLKSSSDLFSDLMVEHPPARPAKGITTRYRFVLAENEDYVQGAFEQPSHVLEREVLDNRANVVGERRALLGRDNENGRVVDDFVFAWENILGAFYNRPLELGDAEEIGVDGVLKNAVELMKIAQYLNCVNIVAVQIEGTFLSLGHVLHQSIAAVPGPWIDFSYRLRSKKIFKEALIHGTGKYNSDAMQRAIRENHFLPSVNQLLADKAERLRKLSKDIQSALISYYPEPLQRAKTVGRADRDSIGRASYANDIYLWMAMSVWKHWVMQMIVNDKADHAQDMGHEFFRLIGRGGDSYLSKAILNEFHNIFPMSQKGESVIENRLTEIKHFASGMVAGALVNTSALNTFYHPAGHMTCTTIDPGDYPWLRPQRELLAQAISSIGAESIERDPLEDYEAAGEMEGVEESEIEEESETASDAGERIAYELFGPDHLR